MSTLYYLLALALGGFAANEIQSGAVVWGTILAVGAAGCLGTALIDYAKGN